MLKRADLQLYREFYYTEGLMSEGSRDKRPVKYL